MWADSDEFGDGEEYESLPLGSWANSKNRTSYVYDKLGESNIRLLSIHPGQFDDEVYCQLLQESLKNLPVYDAISYTWADDSGDRQKNKTIRLGSELFAVTTSCQLALRRARLHGKLTVWIDAVCINQDDKNERTHQVRLMAQVYANARSVMVYIGEESTTSSEAIGIITGGVLPKLLMPFGAVAELLSRPYFWRVWVLQEIALARKATLVCGNATIPWADFATRIRRLHMVGGLSDPGNKWPFLRDKPGRIGRIPLALSFVTPEFRSIEQLPRLLDLSSFCEATDPRDKVYGLLGLATGTEGYGFFPDYNTDLEGVYIKTAILIAASCGVLPLLVRAVCRRSISRALPWVPDWRSHSPVSSTLNNEVSILDEIRQDVGHTAVSGSPLSTNLSTSTSVHFTATPVCKFQDLLDSETILLAHLFPAQNSPNLGLIFSPSRKRNLETASPSLAEALSSLWLFYVQSQLPTANSDARTGCLRNCLLLTALPISFTPAETADSVVGLPFLGLIKFLYFEEKSERKVSSWITSSDPIQARLSREPSGRAYPDIAILAQFGVLCTPTIQQEEWEKTSKLLGTMERTLQRLHRWQEQSLISWRDWNSKNSNSPWRDSWPMVLWRLWLLSGLRRWQLQRPLPRQELHKSRDQEWREQQELLEQEWLELQQLHSWSETDWWELRARQGSSSLVSKFAWNAWWTRLRKNIEIRGLGWNAQIHELREFLDELATQLQSLQGLEFQPTQDPESQRQQEQLIQDLGDDLGQKLLGLTEVSRRWVQEERQRQQARLFQEWGREFEVLGLTEVSKQWMQERAEREDREWRKHPIHRCALLSIFTTRYFRPLEDARTLSFMMTLLLLWLSLLL